jgi:hypothetical protein
MEISRHLITARDGLTATPRTAHLSVPAVNSLSRPVDPKTATALPIWTNCGVTSISALVAYSVAGDAAETAITVAQVAPRHRSDLKVRLPASVQV